MTVKHSLLAILTMGTAYGLELRDELVARAPHREGINVGQVYGTLERLRKAALVADAGATDDNLQLYSLTADGRQIVNAWMSKPAQDTALDWTEMLDQVLMVSSIPDAPYAELEMAYREFLAPRPTNDPDELTPHDVAVASATSLLNQAAEQWLDAVRPSLHIPSAAFRLSRLRPRRGRRSSVARS